MGNWLTETKKNPLAELREHIRSNNLIDQIKLFESIQVHSLTPKQKLEFWKLKSNYFAQIHDQHNQELCLLKITNLQRCNKKAGFKLLLNFYLKNLEYWKAQRVVQEQYFEFQDEDSLSVLFEFTQKYNADHIYDLYKTLVFGLQKRELIYKYQIFLYKSVNLFFEKKVELENLYRFLIQNDFNYINELMYFYYCNREFRKLLQVVDQMSNNQNYAVLAQNLKILIFYC